MGETATKVDMARRSVKALAKEVGAIEHSEWAAQPAQRDGYVLDTEELLMATPSSADGARVVSVDGLLKHVEQQNMLLEKCESMLGALAAAYASYVPTNRLLLEQKKVMAQIVWSRAAHTLQERELDVLDTAAAFAAARAASRADCPDAAAAKAVHATFQACKAAKEAAVTARDEAKETLEKLGTDERDTLLLLDAALLGEALASEGEAAAAAPAPAAATAPQDKGSSVGEMNKRQRLLVVAKPAAPAPAAAPPKPAASTAAFTKAVDALLAVDRAAEDADSPHFGEVIDAMEPGAREALLRPLKDAAKVLWEQHDFKDGGLDQLAGALTEYLKTQTPTSLKPWKWAGLIASENFDS